MKKCFLIVVVVVSVFLLSCADTERNNPYDERAVNYIGKSSAEGSSSSVETDDYPSSSSEKNPASSSSVEPSSSAAPPSSSSETESSSSVAPSSSSVEPSSSSIVPSSSSTAPNSSSSIEEQSSSSAEPSSSSIAPSSSSVAASISSAVPSSSSIAPSSSSVVASSSSNVGCAGFVNGTKRQHYEKDKEQFCDERDGKKYVYVQIDTQTWMAENLNYNADGSMCYGDNTGGDSQNRCDTYGRLYNWATAMGFESSCNSNYCSSQINSPHRGICPDGWHIPSDAEWTALTDYVGSTAGIKLKAKSEWNYSNGTDDYGFSALPGGRGLFQQQGVSLNSIGSSGTWQSATESASVGVWSRNMNNSSNNSNVNRGGSGKSHLFSLRCVRD